MRKTPMDSWIAETCKIRLDDGNALEQWQLEKLNCLIDYARKNSPYYKSSLKNVKNINSISEIARLPFTDSEILRDQGSRMLCLSQGDISRVVTLSTSGTVDSPKRLYFTEDDQALTVDFFCHGMSTLAYPGEKVLIALPCVSEGSVGDLLAKGLVRLGALPVRYGLIRNLREAAEVLRLEQPEVCVGVPVQMLALSAYCAHHGIQTGVKRILLSTDYAAESLIGQMVKNWGCEVFNHYGMTEMGLGGAVECSAHSGMHIRENDLYMEVIDPITGERLPDEMEGELVFTTLTRRGMPLIRYRTGDRGMLSGRRCRCGSILKRVLYVGERIGEKICNKSPTKCDAHLSKSNFQTSSSKKLGIQKMDERIFGLEGVVDYRLEYQGDGSSNMTVWVIGISPDHGQEAVRGLLDQTGLENVKIEVLEAEEMLPPYNGKRKISTHYIITVLKY